MLCDIFVQKRISLKIRTITCFIFFLMLATFSQAEENGNEVQVNVDEKRDVDFENPAHIAGESFKPSGKKPTSMYHIRFMHAFVKSILVIIVSEIGDKTFFIAAIFAMKHARSTVFAGAIGALGLMTFLSVVLGYATTIIPRWLTHYVAMGLFLIFGIKMLHEGISMSPQGSQEEIEEVQEELNKTDEKLVKSSETVPDVESGLVRVGKLRKIMGVLSPVLIQSFTLTFLAEWGDRSQITTIVLAASDDPVGVFIGAVIGHALCTGLAVIGGRMIAQKISVRTVTIIGGVFFIINAIFSFFTGPGS